MRVQPQELKLLKEDTVIQVYRAWNAKRGYSNFAFSKGATYQFFLLVACTIFQSWHDYPLYGRLYCYDNVWADTLLRGGNEVGYFDFFTWEGYGEAWLFKVIFSALRTNIMNSIYASMFAMYYVANSDMVWCFPGETISIGPFNGCNLFG